MKRKTARTSKSLIIGTLFLIFLLSVSISLRESLTHPNQTPHSNISGQSSAQPASNPVLSKTPMDISQYTDIPQSELRQEKENSVVYYFHSLDTSNPEKHSFTIHFPKDWKAMTFVDLNNDHEPGYGNNLLLVKDDVYVMISQQLWESGSCVSDVRDVFGMATLCDKLAEFPMAGHTWKVYKFSERNPTTTGYWKQIGICDQNLYAEKLKNPTPSDFRDCLTVTKIGNISYSYAKENTATYQDFLNMMKSIEIH